MEKTGNIILVTGATGRQGGATARHLMAAGWQVRAFTRSRNSPAAQALHRAGAEIVEGDNNDRASLEVAMQDVYGVFSLQFASYADEVRQGKNVAEVAEEARVQHFVYASTSGAERQSRLRPFSKWEIEQYIQALDLPTTILRPTAFMDYVIGLHFGVPRGAFTSAFNPDVAVQLIAVDDIGAFATLVFDHPNFYLGQTIELAGDALTPPQIAAAISRTVGRPLPSVQIPIETLRRQNADAALAYDFVNKGGYQADISALRKLHPGLMDFATWLEKTGKTQLEALEHHEQGSRMREKLERKGMQQKDELNQHVSSSVVRQRQPGERVGIYIQASDTVDAITRIREAERAGVQQVWMAMGGAGFADILTVLAIAATQTERIKLGTAIVPASPRHPLVTAQQALAVHDIAPERLRLGVGSGNRPFLESRYGLSQTTPLRYLKEYVEILRGVLWQGKINHQGEFFQVVDTLPRTAQVPLLIPALGLKAFRLAGEIADGALASLCPVSYLLNQALPALRAGAEEQSRPTPPLVACLPVALSTDETAALRAVRQFVQQLLQTSTYAHMFSLAGWASAVDGDETALRDLAQALVISGNETTVRDRVQELLASGLDELLLLAIPIADEAKERRQLLHLIGSL